MFGIQTYRPDVEKILAAVEAYFTVEEANIPGTGCFGGIVAAGIRPVAGFTKMAECSRFFLGRAKHFKHAA